MKMRKLIALLLCVVMVVSLAACSNANEGSSPESDKSEGEVTEIVIAESFNLMDDNVTNIYNCIEKAIEDYNEEHADIHITNLHTDAQGSLDKQISDIESLIVQEPDVMYIQAVDSDGTAPAAQAAQEAGIKVVDYMGMPYGFDVRYNAFTEYDAGVMLCEWLDTYFEENPDTILHAAILNGSQANTAQIPRLQAVKEYAEEHPDRLEILVDYFGDWTTDDAMNVTEDWLQTYPEMNAVFAASDQVALGVCNVVEANGLTDEFIISGFDGTDSGLSLIEEGKMSVSIAMNLDVFAKNLVDLCAELALGNYTSDTYDGTGVLVSVDKTNLEEFRASKESAAE